jgi:hypothetical protein
MEAPLEQAEAIYPRDAAAAILARLPPFDEHGALPTEEQLAALLETAFFASLMDDEGRPTVFRLTFAGREEPRDPAALRVAFRPRPFTVDAVRRLAPATDTTGASMAVAPDGDGLVLWGVLLAPPGDTVRVPGRGIHLVARERGAVEVSVGRHRVASYVRGTLRLYEQYIRERELLRVIERIAPSVAGLEPHAELRAILRIADAITDFHHGGTLLVVPEGPYEAVPGLRPLPRYALQAEGQRFLADALATYRRRSGADARELRRAAFSAVAFEDWEQERLADVQARRALEDAVQLVAGFTAVDGAVVVTASLEVLAFGAMIDVVPDPALTDVVSVDPFAPELRRRQRPQSFGGARHQSAIAFCRQQPRGALAFAASHDGTLTFFLRSPEDVIALRPLDLSATR